MISKINIESLFNRLFILILLSCVSYLNYFMISHNLMKKFIKVVEINKKYVIIISNDIPR